MDLAAGALSAKAKAMYGRRLRPEDYQNMLQKKTVPEVASYLKQETYFSSALEGVNENSVHRGQLESLIRMDLFQRFCSLMRYVDTKKDGFYRYAIIKQEIDQILSCLRSVATGDKLSFIATVPIYLDQYTSFEIDKLAQVETYQDLLHVMKGTEYYSIIEEYKVDSMDDFDFNGFENQLQDYYVITVKRLIDQGFSGKIRKELKQIFMSREELQNIQKIYRMKKYFKFGSERIKSMIHIDPVYLSKRETNSLIDEIEADEIFSWLKGTPYGKYIQSDQFVYIEHHIKKIFYGLDKKYFSFNTNPDLITLSYMYLSELEIQNIIDIIEGVRYRIAPEKISRHLVY